MERVCDAERHSRARLSSYGSEEGVRSDCPRAVSLSLSSRALAFGTLVIVACASDMRAHCGDPCAQRWRSVFLLVSLRGISSSRGC